MSEASLATSVPLIPNENPTSAFFRQGASPVPSPKAATTLPIYYSPTANMYLSSGRDLARTRRFLAILLNY